MKIKPLPLGWHVGAILSGVALFAFDRTCVEYHPITATLASLALINAIALFLALPLRRFCEQ